MDWKKKAGNALLGFVLITIGFAIGKEVTLRQKAPSVSFDHAPASAGPEKLIVYYMHATVRCVTCNTIEKMAHAIVQRDFARELQDGRLDWQVVNYQEREDLAKRYNVASNGVVLVKLKDGKDLRAQVLKDVWVLVDDKPKFEQYVAEAIHAELAPETIP
jgi:hypothetical protein